MIEQDKKILHPAYFNYKSERGEDQLCECGTLKCDERNPKVKSGVNHFCYFSVGHRDLHSWEEINWNLPRVRKAEIESLAEEVVERPKTKSEELTNRLITEYLYCGHYFRY